jgi:hypothetical protein
MLQKFSNSSQSFFAVRGVDSKFGLIAMAIGFGCFGFISF